MIQERYKLFSIIYYAPFLFLEQTIRTRKRDCGHIHTACCNVHYTSNYVRICLIYVSFSFCSFLSLAKVTLHGMTGHDLGKDFWDVIRIFQGRKDQLVFECTIFCMCEQYSYFLPGTNNLFVWCTVITYYYTTRYYIVVVVVDSHIQRIVLATEETTVTQQVSHRPIKRQSRLWSQRGTKVNGSHHGDNPLLRPTGIQIATKRYAALQAMAPTNIKTVHQTSLLHSRATSIDSECCRLPTTSVLSKKPEKLRSNQF